MERPRKYEEQLLEDARWCIRRRNLSVRTEESYLSWIRRYLAFAGVEPGEIPSISRARAYVEHLTRDRQVSPSTQNLAASALAFLYREVFRTGDPEEIPRARARQRRPEVLSGAEVRAVLRELSGVRRLAGALMYGSGLRLTECLQLRVKDVSFHPRRLAVRAGKGGKDRDTLLPRFVEDAVRRQIARVEDTHRRDREGGHGWARLPGALHIKSPRAGYELAWQFLFPGGRLVPDPATGRLGRYHLHSSVIQRAVKTALGRAGIHKRASCHSLRHSFATHYLRMGLDIQTLKELMGHKDIKTTMVYAHVLNRPGFGIESPLDRLMRD